MSQWHVKTPVLGTPVGATKEILSNFDPKLLFRDKTPEAMATGIHLRLMNTTMTNINTNK